MQGNVERLARLEKHRHQMLEAGPFARMAVLLRDGDVDLMQATYREFEPAVPVTQEGTLAAVAGFLGVWGSVLLLMTFVRTTLHRRARAT